MLPFLVPAALLLWITRRVGLKRLPTCRALLVRIGVLPLRRHYYEPFVTKADLTKPLEQERDLPGIDWNLPEQLEFLSTLNYESELADIFAQQVGVPRFDIKNNSFTSGDAEYLYQIIRKMKPARVIEIGAGQSTLVIRAAIERNRRVDGDYGCDHICIEPYESAWLERTGARVLRQKVQEVDRDLFQGLRAGDLLFIDSSHIIRPQGDVLAEYLQILPGLRSGVVVHIHDIFTPRDYPAEWVLERYWLWNEQYLLEAFLTQNVEWRILGALNLLKHRHFAELRRVCPYLTEEREPGSIYIQKRMEPRLRTLDLSSTGSD
jgi:predicted O-methyltransferase YrrM